MMLRHINRRTLQRLNPQRHPHHRTLSTATDDEPPPTPSPTPRETAETYNSRRSSYKRSISALRKQYHKTHTTQKHAETQRLKSLALQQTRAKAERQRLKNIRSTQNALRQEERRRRRQAEFEEELRVAETEREERKRWFERGRALLLEELEEESVGWMASGAEVERAFGGVGVGQRLWGVKGGFVGAAVPADDAAYWSMESHTWDMANTYKTPRDLLWDDLEDHWYRAANVHDVYWTGERLAARTELEEKARLRALVRDEGRKALLMRQRSMMQDELAADSQARLDQGLPVTPKIMPAPDLNILADYTAMEREGARLIDEDPKRFFRFEHDSDDTSNGNDTDNDDTTTTNNNNNNNTNTTSLGKPTGLRDPLRDSSPTHTPFPLIIARSPQTDTRSEKEKKKQEKERKMWAAAAQQSDSQAGIEFAAEDDKLISQHGDVDYDKAGEEGDEFDKEWERDLDPVTDRELLDTPRENRYTVEDIDWVIGRLERKIELQDQISKMAKDGEGKVKDELDTNNDNDNDNDNDDDDYELSDDDITRSLGGIVPRKPNEPRTATYVDPNLHSLVDADRIDSILSELDEDQIRALRSLDSDQTVGMDPQDIKMKLGKVPGLSEEQVDSLVELELELGRNDRLVKELEGEGEHGGGRGDRKD